MSLAQSWARTWNGLGLQAPAGLLEALLAAYSEPHRRYHTLQHLEECIAHFSGAEALAQHPGEVGIALWFHDAVYALRAKDNERRSAEWAAQALTGAGADDSVRQRVVDLVMATCHEAVPEGADQKLLVDVDLAILGASPERFAQYEEQVRAEYAWVPGVLYRMKRREILGGFLARECIYNTDYFRSKYEARARANLARYAA